jgi:hypothetical protein
MNNSDTVNIKAEGAWTWSKAKEVMAELKKVGIDCGEVPGGIWLSFDLQAQGNAAVRIIKAHRGRFCTQTFMMAVTLENAQRIHRERQVEKLEEIWNLE